ncbi:MAG: hypothetical protein ACYDC9_08180 [Dermatophilaceae bacterium]
MVRAHGVTSPRKGVTSKVFDDDRYVVTVTNSGGGIITAEHDSAGIVVVDPRKDGPALASRPTPRE